MVLCIRSSSYYGGYGSKEDLFESINARLRILWTRIHSLNYYYIEFPILTES